ncbi:MAG: two-component regulator propeller domain-containing protein, partial [Bacteroidota bacterium]
MRHIYFLFISLFIFFYSPLYGQEKNPVLISGDFKELKIDQFVKELEAKSNHHFYYDPQQLDSFRVTLTAKGETLSRVLELAFQNTGIKFSIDQYNNVFLIKDKTIRTELPTGFFGKTKNLKDSSASTISEMDLAASNKNTTVASLENKVYEIGAKNIETKTGNATVAVSNNYVPDIFENRKGNIWVATRGGGMNRYDREKDAFTSYKNDPQNKNSISSNLVLSVYEDSYGIVWAG